LFVRVLTIQLHCGRAEQQSLSTRAHPGGEFPSWAWPKVESQEKGFSVAGLAPPDHTFILWEYIEKMGSRLRTKNCHWCERASGNVHGFVSETFQPKMVYWATGPANPVVSARH